MRTLTTCGPLRHCLHEYNKFELNHWNKVSVSRRVIQWHILGKYFVIIHLFRIILDDLCLWDINLSWHHHYVLSCRTAMKHPERKRGQIRSGFLMMSYLHDVTWWRHSKRPLLKRWYICRLLWDRELWQAKPPICRLLRPRDKSHRQESTHTGWLPVRKVHDMVW